MRWAIARPVTYFATRKALVSSSSGRRRATLPTLWTVARPVPRLPTVEAFISTYRQMYLRKSKLADGNAFGKPVWDFKYPESSFFITEGGLTGCSISTTRPGDMICVALGSTYPFILRPDGDHFLLRGYAYVHGIMHGERRNSEGQVFRIH